MPTPSLLIFSYLHGLSLVMFSRRDHKLYTVPMPRAMWKKKPPSDWSRPSCWDVCVGLWSDGKQIGRAPLILLTLYPLPLAGYRPSHCKRYLQSRLLLAEGTPKTLPISKLWLVCAEDGGYHVNVALAVIIPPPPKKKASRHSIKVILICE